MKLNCLCEVVRCIVDYCYNFLKRYRPIYILSKIRSLKYFNCWKRLPQRWKDAYSIFFEYKSVAFPSTYRARHLQQRKKERKTDTFGHLLATLQISNYHEEWYVFIQITYVYVRLYNVTAPTGVYNKTCWYVKLLPTCVIILQYVINGCLSLYSPFTCTCSIIYVHTIVQTIYTLKKT